jgi:hypothetical protein
MNMNDAVDSIHLSFFQQVAGKGFVLEEENRYASYISAARDKQAVEGSLSCDQIMASLMIRDRARILGHAVVADAKLVDVSKALNVVLRRYGLKSRRL